MPEPRMNLTNRTDTDAKQASGDATQALLSGAVFGALGAFAGNRLGSKGGDHGPRMFGKQLMTWLGGVTTALVAVYVSLKSSAADKLPDTPDDEHVVIRKPLMEMKPGLGPLPLVQADDAALEGQTAATPEKEMTR